ncbi:hypothetical protein Hanom_Chr13g01208621 [Helianthus anomalus]
MLDKKLVKGCFQRMGYNGYINATSYAKSCVLRPHNFLMHVVVQCLGHRKGGYDVAPDYPMSAIDVLGLFGHLNEVKYVAPEDGKWRHDDSNPDGETEKIKKFMYSKSKQIKKEDDSQGSQKKRNCSQAKKVIDVEEPEELGEEDVVISVTSDK